MTEVLIVNLSILIKRLFPVPQLDQKVFKMFKAEKFTIEALKEILLSYDFNVPFEDIDRDTRLIFDEIAPNIISQKENLFLEK